MGDQRIYVACLAAYNGGRLHGTHIDLAECDTVADVWSQVEAMLKRSPEPIAEEWAIHDHEGFGGWNLSEYESFATVLVAAKLIELHDADAVGGWLANDETPLTQAVENNTDAETRQVDTDAALNELEESFNEQYAGTWDSERAFAENLVDETGLPGIGFTRVESGRYGEPGELVVDALSSYLDWDAITRDLMVDYTTVDVDGGIAVFRSF